MKNEEMHPDDRKNMILFIIASLVVWFGFDHYMIQPRLKQMRAQQEMARIEALADTKGDAKQAIEPRADVLSGTSSRRSSRPHSRRRLTRTGKAPRGASAKVASLEGMHGATRVRSQRMS